MDDAREQERCLTATCSLRLLATDPSSKLLALSPPDRIITGKRPSRGGSIHHVGAGSGGPTAGAPRRSSTLVPVTADARRELAPNSRSAVLTTRFAAVRHQLAAATARRRRGRPRRLTQAAARAGAISPPPRRQACSPRRQACSPRRSRAAAAALRASGPAARRGLRARAHTHWRQHRATARTCSLGHVILRGS